MPWELIPLDQADDAEDDTECADDEDREPDEGDPEWPSHGLRALLLLRRQRDSLPDSPAGSLSRPSPAVGRMPGFTLPRLHGFAIERLPGVTIVAHGIACRPFAGAADRLGAHAGERAIVRALP
jgi:hypothetical protein